MQLSSVLHSRLCEKTLVDWSERSSGFSAEVSEVSRYHQGKLTVLSLLSWPRSLYGIYIEHKSSISVSGGCGVNYWPSRTTLLTLAHPCMEKTLSLALRWIIVAVYISPLSWRQLSLQGNPWRAHRPALHSYRFGMSHDHRVFFILNPNNCILTECCANKHSACCTSEH